METLTISFIDYCKQELEEHKEYDIEYDDYSIGESIEYTVDN